MTMRGYSNLKRVITRFENKHHVNLMRSRFSDDFIEGNLIDLIESIKTNENPRFNCGYSIKVIERELCVLLDNKAIFFAPLSHIQRKLELLDYGDNFPQWALSYVVNNDPSGLSDDDIAGADQWLSKKSDALDLDGEEFSCFDFGEDTGFYAFPAFGMGCDCVHYEIWGYKHSDILEDLK